MALQVTTAQFPAGRIVVEMPEFTSMAMEPNRHLNL
jgi:hypothetical protein